MVADKVPIVDHVNDVVQTVVRPTAGGIVFGAGSSSHTATVTDPGTFFGSHQWVPIAAGVLIALCVHTVKAASRPVINATTAGFGAPVASTAEDFSSLVLSLLAILLPILVLLGLVLMVGSAVWVIRRRRQRKRERHQVEGVTTQQLFG
jgi:LPXTG-motif cell wall-anchored protein